MTRWLTARGVDPKRITKEMKAMDTVGNYEYIVPMLRKRGVSKVMLITVHYHLNRSSALADAVFEHRGLPVEVIGVAEALAVHDVRSCNIYSVATVNMNQVKEVSSPI